MKSFVQKFNATFGADMAGPCIAFVAVMLISISILAGPLSAKKKKIW